MAVNEEKAKVRAEICAIRIRPEEREEASSAICNRIKALEVWKCALRVLLFASLPDEPGIMRLFDPKKIICFPRFKPDRGYQSAISKSINDLVPGKFGILEPPKEAQEVEASSIDITLVPGLAFDKLCNRLGRGRGFYDQWLSQLSGTKIGVGFDHQLLGSIPVEEHDRKLDMVITPSEEIIIS